MREREIGRGFELFLTSLGGSNWVSEQSEWSHTNEREISRYQSGDRN